MKKCELCKFAAKSYCESDQASLCWDCDAKVHAANFLVARHCRTLLCNICQSPTPWSGSGANLGHTVSVCEKCADCGRRREKDESEGANEYDDDDDETDGGDESEKEDEGENQVVPWASKSPPPPPASSSSSDGGSSASDVKNIGISSLKRIRDQVDLGFYLSSRKLSRTAASIDSFRHRITEPDRSIRDKGIWSEESRAIDLNLPPSPSR